jgi:hypothetical protein
MAFVVSLALPAFKTYYGPTLGIWALASGPLGVLGNHYSWFANVLLLLSWKNGSPESRTKSILYALAAFGLACTFLIPQKIPQGSAGWYDYEISTGYFVWLASIAMFAASAVVLPSEQIPGHDGEMPNNSLERTREG